MKFILISDMHGTSSKPINRIDNPIEVYLSKTKFILEYAKKENADIISSGDFFNSSRDIAILFEFLKIKKNYPEVLIHTVYGQHDLHFRNKEVVHNIGLLSNAGIINIVGEEPYTYIRHDEKNINIYGCSWEEQTPKVKYKYNDCINILSIHAPITEKPLFFGHEIKKPMSFHRKNNNFNLIICGDIHKPFISKSKYGIICNTGPIMRLKSDEKHKPRFYIYDTKKEEIKTVFIPSQEANEIFQKNNIEETKQKISDVFYLSSFVLNKYKNNIDIQKIISEIIEKKENKENIKKVIGDIS